MTGPREPQPWDREDGELPDSLREALGAARQDGPTAEELSEAAAGLGPEVLDAPLGEPYGGAPSPEGSAGGGGAQAAGWGVAGKTAAGVVLVGLGVGVAYLAWVGGQGSSPNPEPKQPRPQRAAAGAGDKPAEEQTAAPKSGDATQATPEPTDKPSPNAKGSSGPGAAKESSERSEKSRPQHAQPTPKPTSVEQGRDRGPARARPTVDEGHGGASELELLKRARAALEAHPARALRLARQHARRFPEGDLVQERQVVVVEALVRLGRVEEARARARRFRQRYPDSIHNRGIDAALERAQDR